MAQQGQPAVQFNALKPATWGSLKLLPQALKSKLYGSRVTEETSRVAYGKENAPVAPSAPPKIGDLSHLHYLGPRRHVSQRYVLQPNLNVSRPAFSAQTPPGLGGLLLPGLSPIATHRQSIKASHEQQIQTPQHQRPSTPHRGQCSAPSSPSLRGRQPMLNPNFLPASGTVSTRLPTPVRINASPGPSPSPTSNVSLMLPKPPSPSRSLSQGGTTSANPFASPSCSSPVPSTTTVNPFALPIPPPIFPNATPVSRSSQQQPASRNSQTMPWSASATQAHNYQTPPSARPSPPFPERSILASIQLPASQPRTASTTTAEPSQINQSSLGPAEAAAAAAVPSPSLAQVVSSVPSIQAALQQALHTAMERKPEAFKVDNFERLFDSMMHPGTAGKLDGPLAEELPDDIRYSDNWYKHCREWNARHKPAVPYVPAGAAAQAAEIPDTPVSGRFGSTPFVSAPGNPLLYYQELQQQVETPKGQIVEQGVAAWAQAEWSAGLHEPPLSDAATKALDVAHHGLARLLAPASGSRTASAALSAHTTTAPTPNTLQQQQSQVVVATTTAAGADGDLWDTAFSQPSQLQPAAAASIAGVAPEVAHTAAALASALEALARDQATAVAAPVVADAPASPSRCLAPALSLAASPSGAPAATHISTQLMGNNAEAMTTPRHLTIHALRKRLALPKLQLVDAGIMPRAASASLADLTSPLTCAAGGQPPSTTTTTPRPGGGGGVDSTLTSAATTPAGRCMTSANTPTTTARTGMTSPIFRDTAEVADDPTRGISLSPTRIELAAVGSRCAEGTEQLQLELQVTLPAAQSVSTPTPDAIAHSADPEPGPVWSPDFPPIQPPSAPAPVPNAAARPPSPVTLLFTAPREMPTPNPAFLHSVGAPAAGPSGLAAAVAAVAAPKPQTPRMSSAGPSTSTAGPAPDPLQEIVVGIEKLSTLKHNILAEDKEVDVASITQMIQLKLAVEQLLARTSTAAAAATTEHLKAPAPGPSSEAAEASAQPPAAAPGAAQSLTQASTSEQTAATPKKQSRAAGFGAFLKNVFSPRSASKQTAAQPAAAMPQAPSFTGRVFGANAASALNVGATAVAPASPAGTAVGVTAPRPVSASALRRQVASPSLAERGRYAALHQKAAARLAEAATENNGTRPLASTVAAVSGNSGPTQRNNVWQRYEQKIAVHRQQLDTTKSQLDAALRKLNDMQAEFDELLLCLGMESAKNKALCDAMRAAGLDPEPILAAIEEQWMAGSME